MKRRKHDEDLEADTRDEPSCCFCKYEGPGEVYDYWAGFCVDYKRTRAFLSSTVHIRAKYRDLRKYHVFVCDVCAGRMRLKRHLPGAIGWGVLLIGCLIGAV